MKKSKLALLMSSMIASVSLTGCDVSIGDITEKLFPNPWDALAVFLAFVVLLIAVFYFAYKPVKKLLKERGDYVEGLEELDVKIRKYKNQEYKFREFNEIYNKLIALDNKLFYVKTEKNTDKNAED